MDIRLNKFISDSGFCSRREADKYIEKGKVTINGKIAIVGDKVTNKSKVKVNGNLIDCRDEYVYIALNKPIGITCTTDTMDTTNIIDFVNYPSRIFNIGRLDKDSEGLILLTDNGDIVNKILRSGNNHEKEYEVTVDKSITDEFIEKMGSGVPILGVMTKKCKIDQLGDKNFRIILKQGLNRQIRRMCEVFGYEVVKLRRVRIMNITLNNIPLGQWKELEEKDMNALMESIKTSTGEVGGAKAATSRSGSSKSRVKKEGDEKGSSKNGGSHPARTSAKGGSKGSPKSGSSGSKPSGGSSKSGGFGSKPSAGTSKFGGTKDSKSPKRSGIKSKSGSRGAQRGASKSAPKRGGRR